MRNSPPHWLNRSSYLIGSSVSGLSRIAMLSCYRLGTAVICRRHSGWIALKNNYLRRCLKIQSILAAHRFGPAFRSPCCERPKRAPRLWRRTRRRTSSQRNFTEVRTDTEQPQLPPQDSTIFQLAVASKSVYRQLHAPERFAARPPEQASRRDAPAGTQLGILRDNGRYPKNL